MIVPDCDRCKHKHGTPKLAGALATLVMRLAMDGYKFEVDKAGYAIWWKKGERMPKVSMK